MLLQDRILANNIGFTLEDRVEEPLDRQGEGA